jgi:hypothetical protein
MLYELLISHKLKSSIWGPGYTKVTDPYYEENLSESNHFDIEYYSNYVCMSSRVHIHAHNLLYTRITLSQVASSLTNVGSESTVGIA